MFEDDGEKVTKKLAGYHQFHAVNKAVESTLKAAGILLNRRDDVRRLILIAESQSRHLGSYK